MYGRIDFHTQLSLTLPIVSPPAGGGLWYWDIDYHVCRDPGLSRDSIMKLVSREKRRTTTSTVVAR